MLHGKHGRSHLGTLFAILLIVIGHYSSPVSAQNLIALDPALSDFSLISPVENISVNRTTLNFEWENSTPTSLPAVTYQISVYRKIGEDFQFFERARIENGIDLNGHPSELFTMNTSATIVDLRRELLSPISYRWKVRAFGSPENEVQPDAIRVDSDFGYFTMSSRIHLMVLPIILALAIVGFLLRSKMKKRS